MTGSGFDRLAELGVADEAIDAAVAARLRRRLERALGVPAQRITLPERLGSTTLPAVSPGTRPAPLPKGPPP